MKVRFASQVSWLPFFAPDAPGGAAGGGGAGGAGGAGDAGNPFLTSLPEPLRAAEHFKDVKDPVDLATRYHAEMTRPFAERLPEDIRALPNFKDYKDLGGLARSHLNLEKMVGAPKERVLLLPQSDDPKEWDAVYGRLGRPEAADKYEVKYTDGYNETDGDRAFKAHMLPVMHKTGVSQRQLNTILQEGWFPYLAKSNSDQTAATEARRTNAINALKTEWGNAFDERLGHGESALSFYERELKLPGLAQEVKDAGLHHSPNLIKLLSHFGQGLKEDGKLQGGGAAGGGHADTLSPVEAQQQIASLRSDQKFMTDYMETAKSGPRLEAHNIAVQRMQRLHQQAFPEQK